MSTITRRQALTGGTAIAALATVPALPAVAGDRDAELFAAIADWRTVRDIYEAEHARQEAIYARVDAEMPEYIRLSNAHSEALWAAPYSERTPEQWLRIEDARKAQAPYSKAHTRRLKELGYDEDITGDIAIACVGACDEAFEVPAHTIAGLKAKVEMRLIQWPEDTFSDGDDGVASLVADIRRLAGEAQS